VRHLIGTLAAACLAPAVASAEAMFSGLGDLPGGDPSFSSNARDVSADGSVVVGHSTSSLASPEAFRWEAGVMTGLGLLPDTSLSGAQGVSADGAVVVGQSGVLGRDDRIEAFRWENGTMTGLGDLPGGSFQSIARATSADGSVVVGQGAQNFRLDAFRWEGGIMLGLGPETTDAMAVSADGSVVVGTMTSANGFEAFLWENGTLLGLGDLPGGEFRSEGRGLSADGTVVVGSSTSAIGTEAFRWKDGVLEGLGTLPGHEGSVANDVSDDGLVVVGAAIRPGASSGDAVVWDPLFGGQAVSIRGLLLANGVTEVLDWNLNGATAISASNRIVVGLGTNPDGSSEGWIAELPTVIPEPASGLLLGGGLLGLAAGRGRRARGGSRGLADQCTRRGRSTASSRSSLSLA
jgi:probable HAF family extracellular repeat protein